MPFVTAIVVVGHIKASEKEVKMSKGRSLKKLAACSICILHPPAGFPNADPLTVRLFIHHHPTPSTYSIHHHSRFAN